MAGPSIPVDREMLWRQYDLDIRLYERYLELVLKFNVFYYAATGALLSYYFAHRDIPEMRYALLFPVAMSVLFALLFLYGASKTDAVRQNLIRIAQLLDFYAFVEYRVLTMFLCLSSALMLVVAAVILIFFFKAPSPAIETKSANLFLI